MMYKAIKSFCYEPEMVCNELIHHDSLLLDYDLSKYLNSSCVAEPLN